MYRWVDHTAELELEIEASTPEDVLAEAAAALTELLGGAGAPADTRALVVEERDRAALLAAFLEELIYVAESESLVPASVRVVELEETRVRSEIDFGPGDPPHLVKAVTYHRLAFEPHGEGWRATAVLDV